MEKSNNMGAFTELVIKDAMNKRDEMMGKVKKKHDKIIREKEDVLVSKAKREMEKAVSEAQKEGNEKVLFTQIEAKKKILLKREGIISEVMASVGEKLKAYTKTEEYADYLKKKAEKSIAELGEGEKLIEVSAQDLKYKEMLEGLDNGGKKITVEGIEDKEFFGGIKVFNKEKNISVDYSFTELLNEAKAGFLQKSGLAIDEI